MDDKKINFIKSIINSAIVTVVFIAVITIAADLFIPLKDWLKAAFTHHWIGKSILSLSIFIVLFFIFYFIPSKSTQTTEKLDKSLNNLYWSSIVSSLIIFVFFIWEAFFK